MSDAERPLAAATDNAGRQARRMRRLGAVIQGLLLGGLVCLALLNLMRVATDAQIFRYQGF